MGDEHKEGEHKEGEHKEGEHKEGEQPSIKIKKIEMIEKKVTIQVKLVNGHHWHYQLDNGPKKNVVESNVATFETNYGMHTIKVFLADSNHKEIASDTKMFELIKHDEHKEGEHGEHKHDEHKEGEHGEHKEDEH